MFLLVLLLVLLGIPCNSYYCSRGVVCKFRSKIVKMVDPAKCTWEYPEPIVAEPPDTVELYWNPQVRDLGDEYDHLVPIVSETFREKTQLPYRPNDPHHGHSRQKFIRPPSSHPMYDAIVSKLSEFNPIKLIVQDVSFLHRNDPAMIASNRTSETHFKVYIVDRGFEGLSRVQRHRCIYSQLDKELKNGIHALEIEAVSFNEYMDYREIEIKQNPAPRIY